MFVQYTFKINYWVSIYIPGDVGEKGEKGLVGTPGPRVTKYFYPN